MRVTRWGAMAWWAAGVVVAWSAVAATAADVPVVISIGEGESHAIPESAVFALDRQFTGDTLKAAMEASRQWIGIVVDRFKREDLAAAEIMAGYPAMESLEEKRVSTRVTVKFNLKIFNEPSASGPSFGALCDKLLATAAELGAKLSMEPWVPADREKAEQEALIAAAASAYPSAESIAGAIRSSIYAVQSMDVLEVSWAPHPDALSGETPLLRCKAKVKAVYQLAPLTQ